MFYKPKILYVVNFALDVIVFQRLRLEFSPIVFAYDRKRRTNIWAMEVSFTEYSDYGFEDNVYNMELRYN